MNHMPRLQFSVRTLLWLTLVVAAFLGGIEYHKAQLERDRRQRMKEWFGESLVEWEQIVEQDRAKSKAK